MDNGMVDYLTADINKVSSQDFLPYEHGVQSIARPERY